ncbi:MAG TPA: RnfABCDGE type electron transport complex subunit D [Patescibacteria group bacterium]|nr:RnfABCDGE type electron transport complex subunit D [Patescibacteria group bacterium]
MLNIIDYLLDRITMYKLVLYVLIALLGIAGVGSILGFIHYSLIQIAVSTAMILVSCLITNAIFAYVFEAPTNSDSVYITALILALIVSPINFPSSFGFLNIDAFVKLAIPIIWIAIWSMASKYILARKKKHIFNPAAVAVAISSFFLGVAASWWVGNAFMMPFVLVGGLLIMRKLRRVDMLFSFFLAACITIFAFGVQNNADLFSLFSKVFLQTSMFFFAFIMLTEPLTAPATKTMQIIYAIIVGVLFAPQVHWGSVSSTPELALMVGNIFAYVVSSKEKLFLHLKEKIQVTPDLVDFVFPLNNSFRFTPGQYMEWTLPHSGVDSRGNRRYFTIASSPTESELHLGVKFYPEGSSFKKNLLSLTSQQTVVGAALAGEFTLPKDSQKKLVFIAGGIGITPFRSMVKYLIDRNENRDMVLLYAVKQPQEAIYHEIFEEGKKIGLKTIYTITDPASVPQGWTGQTGRVSKEMIMQTIPDYTERKFYLSGPHAMVNGYEAVLKDMGIKKGQIKIDFFPGFV